MVELADGGTVFLDEVGEMSLDMQTKLLRFIETGELRRVGEDRIRKIDVRIISATNRELENEISRLLVLREGDLIDPKLLEGDTRFL